MSWQTKKPDMGKYLITGRGGSGKSTICELLVARGFNAFDSDDIPGLARAEDFDGNPITVDWGSFVDYSKIGFNWQQQVLGKFLAEHPHVFLCGSASNQLQFHRLFDKVFVLSLDRESHEAHLLGRKSEYGKDPTMLAYLLDEQQKFTEEALRIGAIPIDASRLPDETYDEILEHIDDRASMAKPRS